MIFLLPRGGENSVYSCLINIKQLSATVYRAVIPGMVMRQVWHLSNSKTAFIAYNT